MINMLHVKKFFTVNDYNAF